jgi:hypothetical protein
VEEHQQGVFDQRRWRVVPVVVGIMVVPAALGKQGPYELLCARQAFAPIFLSVPVWKHRSDGGFPKRHCAFVVGIVLFAVVAV